jgi:hypothetical protein
MSKSILEHNLLQQEERWRSAYDQLFGYFQAHPDPYARSHMVRNLDVLYEDLVMLADQIEKLHTEIAAAKAPTLARSLTDALTAPSSTASGSSAGASSRDLSYPVSEDAATR